MVTMVGLDVRACIGKILSDPWLGKSGLRFGESKESDGESPYNTMQYDT